MGLSISHDALNWGSNAVFGWNSRIKNPIDCGLINVAGGCTVTAWANAGPSGTFGTGFPALFHLTNSAGDIIVRVGLNDGFGWNEGCPIDFGVNGGTKTVGRNNFWSTSGAWKFVAGVNEDASDHLQGSISFYEGDEATPAQTVTPNLGSADGPSSGSGAPGSAEGVDVGFLYNGQSTRRSGGNVAFVRFDFRPLTLTEVQRIQHDPFYMADVWPCYIFLPGLDGDSLIRDYGPWSNAVGEFSTSVTTGTRPSVGASPSLIPERALALRKQAEYKRLIKPYQIPTPSVASDTNVNANTEALTIAPQSASIALDVNIAAATEAISLSPLAAQIGFDRDIQAGTEVLAISSLSATIAADTGVTVSTAGLTISAYQASVQSDIEISANTEALTLTEYPATVSTAANTNIDAVTEGLSLSTSPVSVTYDVGISANTESLTIAAAQAVVSVDVSIVAATEALTVTPQTATVNYVAGVDVAANVVSLALSGQRATVEGVFSRRGGDDAPGMFTGEAKRFFYDKQIEELERFETKVNRLKKAPPKRRAEQARIAFDPFKLPETVAKPIERELTRFEQHEINYRQFRDAVARYVAMAEQEKRERRKRQNNDAAVALLFAA